MVHDITSFALLEIRRFKRWEDDPKSLKFNAALLADIAAVSPMMSELSWDMDRGLLVTVYISEQEPGQVAALCAIGERFGKVWKVTESPLPRTVARNKPVC